MKSQSVESKAIEIKAINLVTVDIPVGGLTSYISHKWGDKAIQMIKDKQAQKAVARRPKRNPKEDYESSMYRDEKNRPCIPGGAFKAAIVSACRSVNGLPMTLAKQVIHVDGELLPIKGRPTMREDMVRLDGGGAADIRYRAEFKEWSVVVKITYDADVLSLEQIVNLMNRAGQVGVGEWRPSSPKSSSGDHGMFHIPPGVKITPVKRKE